MIHLTLFSSLLLLFQLPLLRLQISLQDIIPKEGKKKKKTVWNFIISFSSFSNCDHTLKAPSWADVLESVTMELFLSSKWWFYCVQCYRKREWLKLNFLKILINIEMGKTLNQIPDGVQCIFMVSLLSKHCFHLFIYFAFCFCNCVVFKRPCCPLASGHLSGTTSRTLTQFSRSDFCRDLQKTPLVHSYQPASDLCLPDKATLKKNNKIR